MNQHCDFFSVEVLSVVVIQAHNTLEALPVVMSPFWSSSLRVCSQGWLESESSYLCCTSDVLWLGAQIVELCTQLWSLPLRAVEVEVICNKQLSGARSPSVLKCTAI